MSLEPLAWGHDSLRNIPPGLKIPEEKVLERRWVFQKANRVALNSLGGLLFNTGRYLEAAQTWEKIPTEMRTAGDYYNLYIAYQALGDMQKANLYKQLSGRWGNFH